MHGRAYKQTTFTLSIPTPLPLFGSDAHQHSLGIRFEAVKVLKTLPLLKPRVQQHSFDAKATVFRPHTSTHTSIPSTMSVSPQSDYFHTPPPHRRIRNVDRSSSINPPPHLSGFQISSASNLLWSRQLCAETAARARHQLRCPVISIYTTPGLYYTCTFPSSHRHLRQLPRPWRVLTLDASTVNRIHRITHARVFSMPLTAYPQNLSALSQRAVRLRRAAAT